MSGPLLGLPAAVDSVDKKLHTVEEILSGYVSNPKPSIGSVPTAFPSGTQAASNTLLSITGSGWLFAVGSGNSNVNYVHVEIDGTNIAGAGKHLQNLYMFGPCLVGLYRFEASLVVKANYADTYPQINYVLD